MTKSTAHPAAHPSSESALSIAAFLSMTMLRVALSLFALGLVHGAKMQHKWFFSQNNAAQTAHDGSASLKDAYKELKASMPAHPKAALAQVSEDGGEVGAVAPPLILKLQGILTELKERRDNIQHLQKTEAQEKEMLAESKQMHSLASTRKGKKTFEKQLRDSEQNYKNTVSMLQDSKNEAQNAAKALLDEMQTAQTLIKKINDEARNMQDDLSSGKLQAKKADKAEDSEEDDEDEDSN